MRQILFIHSCTQDSCMHTDRMTALWAQAHANSSLYQVIQGAYMTCVQFIYHCRLIPCSDTSFCVGILHERSTNGAMAMFFKMTIYSLVVYSLNWLAQDTILIFYDVLYELLLYERSTKAWVTLGEKRWRRHIYCDIKNVVNWSHYSNLLSLHYCVQLVAGFFLSVLSHLLSSSERCKLKCAFTIASF